MWILFTAHKDESNKTKMVIRFCENQNIATLVSNAFLNKLKAEGKDFDFVSYEFCSFNIFSDFTDIKGKNDLYKAILANPCEFSRRNDIGCVRLHQYI